LVDLMSKFAEQKKATPAQVALAWLLSRKPRIENLGALKVKLTADDLSAIETASSHIKIEGARYPEFHDKLVGR